MDRIVLYGATGYIGALTARTAVDRGLRPVLAGRNADRLGRLAAELGLPARTAALDDPAALDALLSDAAVLLNAAGPFARTQAPLLDACLRTGTHYLDLSGEAAEFTAVRARDAELRAAGVMALPGAGFGVVPTDAMAVHLIRRLPTADRLELSFATRGAVSRGTLETLLAGLGGPGVWRRGGRLVPVHPAGERRRFHHDGRTVTVHANPWRADVVSAGTSTGVPDVSAFTAFPAPVVLAMRLARRVPALVTAAPSRRLQARLLRRLPAGPTAGQLAAGAAVVHGVATDSAGGRVAALLTGPDAYLWTAHAAVELLARTAAGGAAPGYATPAQRFGLEVALTTPGTALRDLG
ncbi:saccharopine dehydrogenase family protein [Micromonospora siamensis]|uniref:Saccharopine dehydrogenase (NAD+, L-lysine forming) n=1 Tax=Micromonospora siamensis TaxID=299152 RepID=A0A1C5JV72_9ACTN|nr:saccharopine dehydrogenase NADP-binding domain-containing protein [Micromonospora siamensis]SCG73936.1 saccharopine dehydrogenase (NAD+, L-lysine forming) [Micromonospora siamensis]